MKYKFPKIEHIDDVLPHIENRDEFIVADKEGYRVINYVVTMPTTFDSPMKLKGAIRRECRGLIFCAETGKILRRPWHKFFNIGERHETQSRYIDLTKNHVVATKHDGSMIVPFEVGDNSGMIRFGTKMGITDVSMQAEVFVAKHSEFMDFSKVCIAEGMTPIFEWCSMQQQIVLEYPVDQLVLTGMRHMITGEYVDLHDKNGNQYIDMAKSFGIPIVDIMSHSDNAESFVQKVSGMTDIEGYVIAFDDGHRVKVKTDWYLRIHKVLSQIRYDRNIAALILNNEIDDIYSHLPEDQCVGIREYETVFWRTFQKKFDDIEKTCIIAKEQYADDRKGIALEYAPMFHKFDRSLIFKFIDGKDLRNEYTTFIKDKLNTNTNYDMVWDWMTNSVP